MTMARKLGWVGGGALVLAALALRLAFFGISVARVPPSSDEALSPLQAAMIMDEGRKPLLVLANTYQFPVESYLHVPWVKILPVTALGARLIPFLLNLAGTAFFILALLRLAPLRQCWPAMLLLLFPSAYVLLTGAAYFIPQHSSFTLLSALALWLALGMRAGAWWRAGLAGFCAGLAFSNHLLAMPLLALLGLYALLGPDVRRTARLAPAFFLGAVLGLLPYCLALWLLPGSYGGGVLAAAGPGEALRRVWGVALNSALSGVMGIAPCLFPDNRARLWRVAGLTEGFAVLWLVVLLAATALCVWRAARRWRESGRLTCEAHDVFVGLAWLGFVSFLFSARSLSHTYRYLLPVAWAFPFLVGYLFAHAPRPARSLVGGLAVLLTAFNVFASLALMRAWRQPDFAAREANLFELQPVIAALEARGLRHACASYWLAYRLSFESGGRVLCSQPFNERFPGWDTPNKDQVDAASALAYVTAPGVTLDTRRFEADLAAMNISCQRADFGPLRVFTDFHSQSARRGARIAIGRIDAAASHAADQASGLVDGRFQTAWTSPGNQEAGMWVQLDLDAPALVSAITISYPPVGPGAPVALGVQARTETGWQELVEPPAACRLDPFDFSTGHPVYGRRTQTVSFPACTTAALRLVIREPDSAAPWIITEIELFEPAP